jgi:hypothetical protein
MSGRAAVAIARGAVSVSLEALTGEEKKLFARLKVDYRALGACLKEEKLSGDSRCPFLRHRKCP